MENLKANTAQISVFLNFQNPMPLSKQGVSSDKEATALKCATVYPFTHHRSLILFEPIKRYRHSQHTVYERFERNPEMQVVEEQEGFLRMSGAGMKQLTHIYRYCFKFLQKEKKYFQINIFITDFKRKLANKKEKYQISYRF